MQGLGGTFPALLQPGTGRDPSPSPLHLRSSLGLPSPWGPMALENGGWRTVMGLVTQLAQGELVTILPIKQTYVLEDELHGHSFLNSCFTFMLIDFKCVHC